MNKNEIKFILRKRISDGDKLELISNLIDRDTSDFYGFNKSVKLEKTELQKLTENYGKDTVDFYIQQLDSYIYNLGCYDRYIDHYRVIIKWIQKEEKKTGRSLKITVKKSFICGYGKEHKLGEECNCF